MELQGLMVTALLVCTLSGVSTTPYSPAAVNPGAYRAQQTLNGLMQYYWQHDPSAKNISFFFACGQIGGLGSSDPTKCSCNNPTSCLSCYRWWDAVAMESLATYGIYTNTTNHSDMPATLYAHSPYNGDYNGAINTYVDDFAWYGIAYLRAYEWLNDTASLNHSIALYDWMRKYGSDEPCGGFWWSTWEHQYFKDSITILEMLHFSSKLAYLFPNNHQYTDKALRIWKWIFSFQNGRGLLTEKNLVSTGVTPEHCCNASSKNLTTRCSNSVLEGTSYNQGLFMSSAAYAYALTKDKQYLDAGMMVLEGVIANYTTSGGALRDEMRSSKTYHDHCQWGQDPGGDWYSFNGIFMLHLAYFTEILAGMKALPDSTLQQIKTLVQRTSDSAWNNSAVWPPFNKTKDACNSNTKEDPHATFPRFHWWWVSETDQQIIPPDPTLFFRKTGLNCVGNHTKSWQGKDEDGCRDVCAQDVNCSKYLYDGNHCWGLSYNRSDYICNGTDQSFNVGIKRPLGNASCKGRCGSDTALELEEGVCYCDDACTKHLDCCLDYADECVKEQYLSCKGFCNDFQAQAIRGGGYCWCFDGCYPIFTDNNSMGSCCPDYQEQCFGVKTPVCLDARSQGSALNLFLAHMKIFSL